MPDVRRELRHLQSVAESLPSAAVVELHGARSSLVTTDPRARQAVSYVFGSQAKVLSGAGSENGDWRVACIRSDDLYRDWSSNWEA